MGSPRDPVIILCPIKSSLKTPLTNNHFFHFPSPNKRIFQTQIPLVSEYFQTIESLKLESLRLNLRRFADE
jgi:hypothetical protein